MTCPNITVKMVKLHDTKFWCCDEFKFDKDWNDMAGNDEGCYDPNWKFCPHCGNKIRWQVEHVIVDVINSVSDQ